MSLKWINSYRLLKRHEKDFQRLLSCFRITCSTTQRGLYHCFTRLININNGHVHYKYGSCSGYQRQVRTLFQQSSNVSYIVTVKTGDQLLAGTDANVRIVLHAESGEKSSAISLNHPFRDDFERGQSDIFKLKNLGHLKDIHKIEIWRDDSGHGAEWFVDYIEIQNVNSEEQFLFPIFRWIKPNRRYIVRHMDNCLPQFDPEPDYRREELEAKRNQYQCNMRIDGGPAQVSYNRFP